MRILITGAGGLIGGEVAARLAERGHEIIALVHRTRHLLRNDRTPIAVSAGLSSTSRMSAPVLLAGDVGERRLGLSHADWQALASDLDLILHCAAVTAFGAPAGEQERVNVGGTANVVELAAAADCPLLHVSTAYVCGSRSGEVGEDGPIARNGLANPYEASKAAAERLLVRARANGLRVAVARPSIVMGDWESGAIRHFCDVYRFIGLIAEGRIRTLPVRRDATLDFVPIDHVARSLVSLAEQIDEACGRSFHLVSGTPIPVSAVTESIGERDGMYRACLVEPDDLQVDRLPALEQRFHRTVTRLYQPYLERSPRFRDDNLRALTGLESPPVNGAYLHRLLDFAARDGLIRPARRAA